MTNAVNLASAAGTGFFRNKIINGGFDVWQRGTSQSTGGYGSADRWNFGWSSGTAAIQKGQDAQPAVGSQYGNYVYLVGTSVVGGFIQQPIEDVRTLAGGIVTVSYYTTLVSGSDTGIAPYLRQYFGSGGSAIVDTSPTADMMVGNRRILTYNIPSTAGKTIVAGSSLSLVIPFAGTFVRAYWGVQVEAGSAATPFEMRPYGSELALCQRYFYTPEPFGMGVAFATASFAYAYALFPVEMRATPTLVVTGTPGIYCGAVNANLSPTGNTYSGANRKSAVVGLSFSGGGAAGSAGFYTSSPTGTFQFSAEL